MDELRECPNPSCSSLRGLHFDHWRSDYDPKMSSVRVKCNCGCCGPWKSWENDAVAAWNALPRKAKWTEYDGTESTLPATYGPFPVERQNSRGKIDNFVWCFTAGNWINSRGAVPPKIGDRWTPWPGEE